MRVAGVIITPPTYNVSGGVSAGIQLMQHVARLCDTRLFLMADRDETVKEAGLDIARVKARNRLAGLAGLLPKPLVTLAWRPNLQGWLVRERPDIVHLHNPHPPGAFVSAAARCRALGIPYVISTHGFVEFNDYASGANAPRWQKPWLDLLLRRPVCRVARGASRIFMLSPEETRILRSMGVRDRQLEVVTNGVDPFFVSPVPETERLRLTARFGLPLDRPIALFVGNHTPNKGLDVLLEAIKAVRQPLVTVVAGTIRSRTEHLGLLARTGTRQNDPRLRFTDFVTREELRALYQSVDIFVFPSRADTLPLVVLEAMASGLPTIATRVGGIPHQLDSDCGILLEPGNIRTLAAALEALCADPVRRQEMGARARKRALTNFDWSVSARKSVQLYVEVVKEAEARTSSSPFNGRKSLSLSHPSENPTPCP